jgi:hypothetical protein
MCIVEADVLTLIVFVMRTVVFLCLMSWPLTTLFFKLPFLPYISTITYNFSLKRWHEQLRDIGPHMF